MMLLKMAVSGQQIPKWFQICPIVTYKPIPHLRYCAATLYDRGGWVGFVANMLNELKVNYARTGDTLLHLRSSYIQCSPRKRTSTAKLLALKNIQSLHIETVWDEKNEDL